MNARPLDGVRVLVTAGPTREPIDPVRFISNRSSGKMGYSIASQAAKLGARVTLITGPTALELPPDVDVVKVETAGEMLDAVISKFPETDVVIKAAAVADYSVDQASPQKIKKGGDLMILTLVPTADILSEIGKKKKSGQVIVGFALETEDLIENAKKKLKEKRCDLMVANDPTKPGAGFELDTNVISIIHSDGRVESLPKMSKEQVAGKILERVVELVSQKRSG